MSNSEKKISAGKYYGVCSSYHHSKGCSCKRCTSYPKQGYMFCARGNDHFLPEKKECECRKCFVCSKFRFEGDFFCRWDAK